MYNTSVIQQATLLPLCSCVVTLTLPTPIADTVQPSPTPTGSGVTKSLIAGEGDTQQTDNKQLDPLQDIHYNTQSYNATYNHIN